MRNTMIFLLQCALLAGALGAYPGLSMAAVDQRDHQEILSALKTAARSKEPEKALKKFCFSKYKGSGTLYPVISRRRETAVYWKGVSDEWILFYSYRLNALPHAYQTKDAIGSLGWIEPKYFDKWLLTEADLLQELLTDKDFLRIYLPGLPLDGDAYSLNRLQAYIFTVGQPEKHYNLAAVIGEDRFFS